MSNYWNTTLSKMYLRYKNSTFDQFVSAIKKPINPTIVLYGSHNKLFADVLKKNFAQSYKLLKIENLMSETNLPKEASNDALLETVAKSVADIDPQFQDGYVIEDFPRNVEQAEKFDQLLEGVNLALHIKLSDKAIGHLKGNYLECTSCGQIFNTGLQCTFPQQPGVHQNCETPTKSNIVKSDKEGVKSADYDKGFSPVFDYYNKRGLLLTFTVDEKWSYEETVERLGEAILANIKL